MSRDNDLVIAMLRADATRLRSLSSAMTTYKDGLSGDELIEAERLEAGYIVAADALDADADERSDP